MDHITNPEEILEIFKDYDWEEAMQYASWSPDQVGEIIAAENGENDGCNWIMVVKLKDGRYSFLSAGCDYTGWDCQAGGHSTEYDNFDDLIRFGLGGEERDRLSLHLLD